MITWWDASAVAKAGDEKGRVRSSRRWPIPRMLVIQIQSKGRMLVGFPIFLPERFLLCAFS
jgi:hypothetical protein